MKAGGLTFADLVQDLYINQLKAYKPAPQVCRPTRCFTRAALSTSNT